MERERAARFFERAEACEIHAPPVRVARQKLREQAGCLVAIALEDAPHSFAVAAGIETRHAVFCRPVSNVLIIGGAGLPLTEKKFRVLAGKLYGRALEVENVSRLESPIKLPAQLPRCICNGD